MGIKSIEKVLIRACEALDIVPLSQIFVKDDFPEGRVTDECIVIHVKAPQRGDFFYKGFVEVNAVVPDDEGRAQHERLEEIEDILIGAFKYDTVGEYEKETYRYGLYSHDIIYEPDAGYHYVNARLTFEILNI